MQGNLKEGFFMSIENLWVNKVSQVNITAEPKRSRSNQQTKRNFSEVLKKASAKINSESFEINTQFQKDPFTGKMGKA
mgnify:CR=1 FL=1